MKYTKTANGNIEISEEDFNNLIKDQKFLQALEYAGVDNWHGYSDACRDCYIKGGNLNREQDETYEDIYGEVCENGDEFINNCNG